MIDSHFVILGAVIALAGTSRYVVDTIKGYSSPNRVSWFLWSLAPLIAFAAELHEGVAFQQTLVAFVAGFAPMLVLLASFVNRKAVWKITRFDLFCGFLSLVGLLLWLITRHGDVAIVFSILADSLAAIPTLIKSYHHPESETWVGYLGHGTNAAITLLTIKHWTFANFGFPLYLMIICFILMVLVRFKLGVRFRTS